MLRQRRAQPALPRLQPRALPASLLALLLLSPCSQADEAEELVARVTDLLLSEASAPGREVGVEVHPSAARLPPCLDPAPFLPHGLPRLPGRVAVGIRCADGSTRYLQASVALSGQYPVARRDLRPGEVLSEEMLELRHGDLGRLPRNSLLELDQALGMRVTRALTKGSALPGNALRTVPLVNRGARVKVEARAGAFVASREGTALDNGGMGEEVRIRTESGSILRARVSGQDLLSVDF